MSVSMHLTISQISEGSIPFVGTMVASIVV